MVDGTRIVVDPPLDELDGTGGSVDTGGSVGSGSAGMSNPIVGGATTTGSGLITGPTETGNGSGSDGLPGPGVEGTTTGGGKVGTVVVVVGTVVEAVVVRTVVDDADTVVPGCVVAVVVDAEVVGGTIVDALVGGTVLAVVDEDDPVVVGGAVVGAVVGPVVGPVVDALSTVVGGTVKPTTVDPMVVVPAIVEPTVELVSVLVVVLVVELVVLVVELVAAAASAADSNKRVCAEPMMATSSPPKKRDNSVAYTERKSTFITMFLRESSAVSDGCAPKMPPFTPSPITIATLEVPWSVPCDPFSSTRRPNSEYTNTVVLARTAGVIDAKKSASALSRSLKRRPCQPKGWPS